MKLNVFTLFLLLCSACNGKYFQFPRRLNADISHEYAFSYLGIVAISNDGENILVKNMESNENTHTTIIDLYNWNNKSFIKTNSINITGLYRFEDPRIGKVWSQNNQFALVVGSDIPQEKLTNKILLLSLNENIINSREITWPYNQDTIIHASWAEYSNNIILYDGNHVLLVDVNGEKVYEFDISTINITPRTVKYINNSLYISGFENNEQDSDFVLMEIQIGSSKISEIYRSEDYFIPIEINQIENMLLISRKPDELHKITNDIGLVNLETNMIANYSTEYFLLGRIASNHNGKVLLGDWQKRKILLFDWKTQELTTYVNDAILIGWNNDKEQFTYLVEDGEYLNLLFK